ncbi:hypothetical protein ACFX13_025883 [Malus domestica]|uniref:Mitochondrial glycoprotein family protein n=1 Tax=Malus domestica TaxID=3750 RepID=A0A498HG56_MALDO|nr:uncharacterized protein At2g39795, mitochondrial [Malus domestica]XP_050133420.1 uncharacterized protein At2g39795, mitochondrial-like [Malus sylvestris]RXH68852.1 hypothetical protein DVH24_031185 [Malus domestica]
MFRGVSSMARLIRPLRKSTPFPSSSRIPIQQTPTLHFAQEKQVSLLNPSLQPPQFRRTYISEMRKSAFEGNILRLLRREIQYELDHSPATQPVTKFKSFTVNDQPGEQWITLKRKFGEKEDIKIEATMFDGSVPIPNSKGGAGLGKDVQLHITMIVNISKKEGGNVFEIMCSAWPDTIEINKLFVRKPEKMPAQPYAGPEFKELDDELQDSLYEFLEARSINDDLAIFLHEYMKNKDKTEFIRWMGTVKSFIEKKVE